MPWHYQRMYLELLGEELEAEQAERGESVQTVNAAGDLSASPFQVTRVS